MSTNISLDEVTKIAQLACLEISPEDIQLYQTQLSEVIDYFKVFDELDLSDTPITSQVTGLENVTRIIDKTGARTLDVTDSISQAPSSHNNYIKVPALLTNRDGGE